mgnify:CR=1 FL=1
MPEIIASTYEIIQKLGSGGGGNVYLANHLRLNKKVVLKADKRKINTPPELLRREVDVLKTLKHPHIPQVYDFFVENETVYTVMDYIEGESLDRILKRGERFPQSQIIEWAMQLLDALVYLHSPIHGDPPKGFIHSDIKPANIMLLPDRSICLIDFNISLALGEENVIGCSAGYSSPEHYGLDYSTNSTTSFVKGVRMESDTATVLATQNNDIAQAADSDSVHATSTNARVRTVTPDVRSDIYSTGATLYHLLSGVRPARDAKEVKPLSTQELSSLVVDIVTKAMQPNPDLRYQSAAEMLFDFTHLREHDPRVKHLKRNEKIVCLICGLMILLGTALAFTGLKRLQTTESWLKLSEYSANALQEGDVEKALTFVLQAFPQQKSPWIPSYVPQAELALTNALGVYQLSDSFQSYGVVSLPSAPTDVKISPDGKTAACMYSENLAVIDTESRCVIQTLPACVSALAEVEYLDNDRIVYAGADGICVYDIRQNHILWQGQLSTGIAVSGDKRKIATVNRDDNKSVLYDADTGEIMQVIDFRGKHQQTALNDLFANPKDNLFALNEDGTLLAVSFSDGSLQLFNLTDNTMSVEILDNDSTYTHFEGGFYRSYFAFSASNALDSIFVVIDTTNMEQTGGYQSEYAFSTYTDSFGIYVQTENILVRIDPVTGEQMPMVTTSKQIQNYAFDSAHTLISTPDTFEFYDPKAQILSSFENTEEMNFLQLQGDIALVAGRNKGEIRLLRYENHPDTEVLAYDSSYSHDEARLSADGQTVTLFSYDQFRIYGVEGELIIDTQIPNAEQVYDQQFRRKGDDSWLEVIYYDGTVLRYDAANGKLLSKENGEKPDSSLYEEFYTNTLRIESPLHGPPVAYDRKTGRKIATLSTDAYLTYITQTANGLVAQYITAEGYFYGELLDDQCRVLATLPYLCDVVGERLIFDYPTGNVRESPIYPVDNLLQMAQDILNGSEKMS